VTIGVGLYGTNGHQVQLKLEGHPHARLVATAAFDRHQLTPSQQQDPEVRNYDTLDELLEDERVQLVSLCSPVRREQAREAIRCLEAGRHVYAEKPCAMTEADLDAILSAAERSGCRFHEMAGTAFEQPYLTMRSLVQAGAIGTVIQVLAQKSYPYHDRRPQDEDVDGGLLMQVGVHALRFIEHVGGVRIDTIEAIETRLGNPRPGDLRMAACLMMRLENGGLASAILNYLNPPAFGRWGNETLRIFGSRGFVEATDGGTRTRLVLESEDRGPLTIDRPGLDYFDLYVASLLGRGEMPLSLEDELHPTRMVIRAKAGARLA
jgi:predicted dehydrogenase